MTLTRDPPQFLVQDIMRTKCAAFPPDKSFTVQGLLISYNPAWFPSVRRSKNPMSFSRYTPSRAVQLRTMTHRQRSFRFRSSVLAIGPPSTGFHLLLWPCYNFWMMQRRPELS